MSDELKIEKEESTQAENQEEVKPENSVEVEEAASQEPASEQPSDKKSKKCKKEKKVLTPEQKKKKAIKSLIITAAVVLVLAVFFGSCAIANVVGTDALIAQAQSFTKIEYGEGEQLIPEKIDGDWTFTTDRELKVLQFTDVHIGGGCFSQTNDGWAMNAVATMIKQEKPDLVVISGDIAYPVPFQAGTFNNLNATMIFANLMESLGVYWTFTFGNHDTELYSMYDRVDICEYYENANFEYCLFERGFCDEEDDINLENSRGFGNNVIKVRNSQGIYTQAIVTLDSHSYIDGDYFGIAWKYDNIHQSQSEWYASKIQQMTDANMQIDATLTEPVKNIAFFHIPLREYRYAWQQCIESTYAEQYNQRGVVISKESANAATVQISDEVTLYYGAMGESNGSKNGIQTYGVFCGTNVDDETFFDTGLQYGLQGTFCGHDHYNNFSVEYKGIRLTYGMSLDYLAYPGIYKEHAQRGCTIITLATDGTMDCAPANYYVDFDVAYEKE